MAELSAIAKRPRPTYRRPYTLLDTLVAAVPGDLGLWWHRRAVGARAGLALSALSPLVSVLPQHTFPPPPPLSRPWQPNMHRYRGHESWACSYRQARRFTRGPRGRRLAALFLIAPLFLFYRPQPVPGGAGPRRPPPAVTSQTHARTHTAATSLKRVSTIAFRLHVRQQRAARRHLYPRSSGCTS